MGIGIRVWALVGVLFAALLFWGVKMTYVALHESKQLEITCADYIKNKPDTRWVKLTECEYDFDHLSYRWEGTAKEIRSVYIPLRPVGGETTDALHIVVKREDNDTIAVVKASEQNLPPPKLALRNVMADLAKPAQGMVLVGLDLDSRAKSDIEGLNLGLAKDFVIVEQGSHPNLVVGLILLAIGVVGGAGYAFLLVRQIRKPKPPPPGPRWGTPQWRGPNAPPQPAQPKHPLADFERPL